MKIENWRAVRGKRLGTWNAQYRGPDSEWCTVRTASGIIDYITALEAETAAQAFYRSHANVG